MIFNGDRIGDRGQRYQVEGKLRVDGEWFEGKLRSWLVKKPRPCCDDGRWFVLGWTDKADGGFLAEGARRWLAYNDVRVVDHGKLLHMWPVDPAHPTLAPETLPE